MHLHKVSPGNRRKANSITYDSKRYTETLTEAPTNYLYYKSVLEREIHYNKPIRKSIKKGNQSKPNNEA